MRWSTLRTLLAVFVAASMCVMLLQHVNWFTSSSSNDAVDENVDTVMLALLHRHDELASQADESFATARGRRLRLFELMRDELPPVENDSDAHTYAHLMTQLAARPHLAAEITDDALLDVLVEHWIYSRRKRLWLAAAQTTALTSFSSHGAFDSETRSSEQYDRHYRRHGDDSD
jgi:hypothetical protein